jgi:hypothetical protein
MHGLHSPFVVVGIVNFGPQQICNSQVRNLSFLTEGRKCFLIVIAARKGQIVLVVGAHGVEGFQCQPSDPDQLALNLKLPIGLFADPPDAAGGD